MHIVTMPLRPILPMTVLCCPRRHAAPRSTEIEALRPLRKAVVLRRLKT